MEGEAGKIDIKDIILNVFESNKIKSQKRNINSEYIPMMSRGFCLLKLSVVSEWYITIGLTEKSGSMRRTKPM